ncbi:MAG: hypothetical protein GY795_34615 [Desulfobacterales bacterium]|nr:hypothetical protein [Desulfobacterales bacterium]
MKFWHSLPCVLPEFHFGTPLSVSRKMKDAHSILENQCSLPRRDNNYSRIWPKQRPKPRAYMGLSFLYCTNPYLVVFIRAVK